MYFLKKNNERSLLDEFSNLFTGNLFSKELKTDIEETENSYNVTVDVPGVDKKDIDLKYHDDVLTISINQEEKNDSESNNYIRRERSYQSISRSFYLVNGDENNINAKLNNGVLSIVVNKLEEKQYNKKTISIE